MRPPPENFLAMCSSNSCHKARSRITVDCVFEKCGFLELRSRCVSNTGPLRGVQVFRGQSSLKEMSFQETQCKEVIGGETPRRS